MGAFGGSLCSIWSNSLSPSPSTAALAQKDCFATLANGPMCEKGSALEAPNRRRNNSFLLPLPSLDRATNTREVQVAALSSIGDLSRDTPTRALA